MTTSDNRAEQERVEYEAAAQAGSRADALFAILAEVRLLEDNLTAVQASAARNRRKRSED